MSTNQQKRVEKLKDLITAIYQVARTEIDTVEAAEAVLECIADDAADVLDLLTGWCGPTWKITEEDLA